MSTNSAYTFTATEDVTYNAVSLLGTGVELTVGTDGTQTLTYNASKLNGDVAVKAVYRNLLGEINKDGDGTVIQAVLDSDGDNFKAVFDRVSTGTTGTETLGD